MQTAVKIPEDAISERFPHSWETLQDAMGIVRLTLDDVARCLYHKNWEEADVPEHVSKENAEDQFRIITESVADICGRFTMSTEIDCELIYTFGGFIGHDQVESFFGHEIELTPDEVEMDCEFIDWEIEGV